MHLARIAELLQPFLSPISNPCHSESGQRPGEACPERSRKPALSLPKGEPAVLSPTQLQHISTYIDILLHWNARINLTAIRDPEEIITRHFGESLFAARHLFPTIYPVPPLTSVLKDFDCANRYVAPNARVADLGSGAGFPGLPIKLWAPQIALTLIESSHKKAAFLHEVNRALTLTDVAIQNVRAEALPPATFHVVTLRAVERFASSLPIAARLLAPAGRLALLISSSQLKATETALPHFSWHPPVQVPGSRSGILLMSR